MAKPITVTLDHSHGVEGMKQRVEDRFEKLQESIGGNMGLAFTREWASDEQLSFTAKGMGQTVNGEIDILPEQLRLTVKLPMLLSGMADAVQGKMEQGGKALIEDGTAGAAS